MPAKIADRRRARSKYRIPTFRIENEYHPELASQYFQITVNILDGRKYVWMNQETANSYVIVRLGKNTRRTSIRRHMEEPYYKEYFVFELFTSVRDIQSLNLGLSVMELRCCSSSRLLGEANIEMATIWNQPYHQIFRKWIQLSLPRDPLAGPVGYLKIDVSIIFRGEVQYIPPTIQDDNIEENMLGPSGIEQHRANYVVGIHGAFSLPNGTHCHGDQRYGKPPSTYVRVTFCKLVAKTSVQEKSCNPIYNERLSFVEMFPNISRILNIEVFSVEGCFSRILCATKLDLNSISHEGENGFLPTYGPSLIHMYGHSCGTAHPYSNDGPYYKGALLVSFKIHVPYYQQGTRTVTNEVLPPLRQNSLWSLEDFCIYCPVLEVSMLDRQVVGKVCGIAITVGENIEDKNNDDEFSRILNEIKSKKLYYTGPVAITKLTTDSGYLKFPNAFPVLQLAAKLPDFRFRMFRKNMIQGIVSELVQEGDKQKDDSCSSSSGLTIHIDNQVLVFQSLETFDSIEISKPENISKGSGLNTRKSDLIDCIDFLSQFEVFSLDDVERRLKTFEYDSIADLSKDFNKIVDTANRNMIQYLDILQHADSLTSSSDDIMRKYGTQFDHKLIALQKHEIHKIYQIVRKLPIEIKLSQGKIPRKIIKTKLAEAREVVDSLKHILFKTMRNSVLNEDLFLFLTKEHPLTIKCPICNNRIPKETAIPTMNRSTVSWETVSDGWPDIIIWLLSGGSRVAYTKLSAADIIYSVLPEQSGKFCNRIQSFYMKPLKCPRHMNTLSAGCYCLAAKVELFFWMGLFRQRSDFFQSIPAGYTLKTSDIEMCLKSKSTIIECRCFIYRAKLNTGLENNGLADTFVRINVLNEVKETQVKTQTLTPVWNQVLIINKFVFISNERLENNPPIILVEVFNKEFIHKSEIVGRVQVKPTFGNRMEYEYAPKLQWYDLYRGIEYVGQLLMSAQIIQVPETLLSTTMYSQADQSTAVLDYEAAKPQTNEIEPLPASLIPKTTTYKLDVYWWGLRNIAETRKPCVVLEIDELNIKSEIILDKKTNCNFPNGRITHEFEAPLKEVYCPPLSISLFDTTTFGRTVFIGTHVVKNPNKYLVTWLPKKERDASLNIASFMTSKTSKVNDVSSLESTEMASSEESVPNYKKVDVFNFSSLFNVSSLIKQKTEEEIILLPILKRNRKNIRKYGVKHNEDNTDKDWWLRFFCSQKECSGEENLSPNNKITVFTSELECQLGFSKFKDWCTSLKLYNGKKTGIPEKDEKLCRGLLKAGIAIYKWPPPLNTIAVSTSGVDLTKGFFNEHPNNDTSKYLVRVYIVKGFNLMAKDFTGKSDPYIIINCGKKQLGDRKSYIPKTLNPIFGKVFEFRASMPDDFQLTISVYDYDVIPPDDLIGCTSIDLEDRIYTKHRATCGLPAAYSLSGTNKWRDCMRPSAILQELCVKNHIPPPIFINTDNTVVVNGIRYSDEGKQSSEGESKENVCLGILREWNTLPLCGYPLVPEHVETRTLFNSDKPGLDQGKLQMWVDIFPLDTGFPIPPAVNIAPRKVEEFELRVIVWDVEGVKLDDYDIITGQKSSDIYVKAWIGQVEYFQQTDIHYRSLTGIGNFNWRMIFKIHYQHAERKSVESANECVGLNCIETLFNDNKIVVKQTSLFSEAEDHVPPNLYIQVMDSDAISADDFLGSLTLNLNSMTRGAKTPRLAKSAEFSNLRKVNLFTIQSLRGWWPLKFLDSTSKKEEAAGVIDLELTLLPMELATSSPVGLGREAPHPLPMPKPRMENAFSDNLFSTSTNDVSLVLLGSSSDLVREMAWQKTLTSLKTMFTIIVVTNYLCNPRIDQKQ